MRYLITGGYGFIGSHYIKHLKNTYPDCEVLNIDNLTYAGNKDNLKDIDCETWQIDIAAPMIPKVLEGFKPDVVVNFAACTHVDRSIRYPREFLETDVMGLFNLVYHSMKCGVERFVHVSTDEVYGPTRVKEFCEVDKLDPTSPYAASKASGDLLMMSYIKTYKFPAIIVRPCNNYGPNQYPEKLIPMAVTRLLQSKPILLHGEGKEVREWIHVYDCCRAIDNVVNKGTIGEIYNIGSGIRHNNINVIKRIVQSFFGTIRDMDQHIKVVPNRPGNDSRYAIDSSKICADCGEYLTVDFVMGIPLTVQWYTQNVDWWKKLDVDLESNLYTDGDHYLR